MGRRTVPINPTTFGPMEHPSRPMFLGGRRLFGHLLLSRSQAAIHPARRMRESIERRLGGRIRMRQPLSVKPRKIGARRNGDSASLGLLFIRKDRTSSLRCRPARSAPRGRAGRLLLPNQCPCAPPQRDLISLILTLTGDSLLLSSPPI